MEYIRTQGFGWVGEVFLDTAVGDVCPFLLGLRAEVHIILLYSARRVSEREAHVIGAS